LDQGSLMVRFKSSLQSFAFVIVTCLSVSVTCIWPWVCSVCRNHNPVLSSLMTYHDLYILHVLWFSQRSFKSVGSSIYKYFFVCYSKHHDNYSIFRSVFKTAPFQCCSLSSLDVFYCVLVKNLTVLCWIIDILLVINDLQRISLWVN
jgi:hypothetical protein